MYCNIKWGRCGCGRGMYVMTGREDRRKY